MGCSSAIGNNMYRKKENNKEEIKQKKIFNKFNKNLTPIYIDEAIKIHNNFRKNHGIKELKLNNDLSKMAQKYAERCAESEKVEACLDLYNNTIIGQNISIIILKNLKFQKFVINGMMKKRNIILILINIYITRGTLLKWYGKVQKKLVSVLKAIKMEKHFLLHFITLLEIY